MAKININPEKLESAAGRLLALGESIQEEKSRMAQAKEGIENGWNSDSSLLFLESLEQTERNLDKLALSASSLSKNLRTIAEEARKIEQQNAGSFLT